MPGYKLGLPVQANTARWFRAATLKAPNAAGGAAIGPAAVLDFARNRYALTATDSAAIGTASAADLASLRAAQFGDAITFSRASAAGVFGGEGMFTELPSDTPRFADAAGQALLLCEPASVNYFKNSKFENVNIGVGCPNLTFNSADGVSLTPVGSGEEDGLPYLDIRFSGTASSGNETVNLRLATADCPSAAQGEYWTYSLYYKRISGSVPSSLLASVQERQASVLLGAAWMDVSSVGDDRSRFEMNYLLADASSDNVWAVLRITTAASVSYDFTLRLYAPQLEKQQYATTPILTGEDATATRDADRLLLGAKLEALLRRPNSTLVLRYKTIADPSGRDQTRYLLAGNDAGNSRYTIRASSDDVSSLPSAVVGDGSTVSTLASPVSVSADQVVAAALSVSPSQSRFCVNGVLSADNPGTGFDNSANAATRFYLSSDDSGNQGEQLFLESVFVYPFEVDPAALPDLTV